MVGRRWIETTIGALVGCKQVSIQTGPFGTVLSASEYVDYGIPVISVREIRQGRIEIYDETPAVSDSTYRRLSQFALKPYDLVFARKGSVDRSALIAEDAQKMFLGSDGIRLRFNNPTLAQIVFHCVQSPQTRQFLTVSAYGTTMAGLNETIISSIPICIPEDAMEQQHIAKALSDMDDMIASLEKLIAKKKAIKQGAMQELLTGKRRLPGFTDEWGTLRLGDVLTVKHGKPQYDIENPAGKYPILATGGIIGRTDQFICNNPSVLIGRKGTIDQPKYMDSPFWTIDTLFYTTIKSGFDAKYVYYVFCMIRWADYNEASGVPSLSATVIENIEITMPLCSEQNAIAALLSEMDTEINALDRKLTKAREIKQGTMQQLLTGERRIKQSSEGGKAL